MGATKGEKQRGRAKFFSPFAFRLSYGVWQQPARQGSRGRHPRPRLVAPADLLSAVVVKRYRQNRVVKVSTRVVLGDPAEVQAH